MRSTQKTQPAPRRNLTQPRTIATSDHGGQRPKNILNVGSLSEADPCQLSKSQNVNNIARHNELVASFGNLMLIVKTREHWHFSGDCCLPHSPGQFGEGSEIDESTYLCKTAYSMAVSTIAESVIRTQELDEGTESCPGFCCVC